jgi:tetratricopeptide (TPR) repeat protein
LSTAHRAALRLDRLVGQLAATLLLCACAHAPPIAFPTNAGTGVELDDTPFFAQETHQCGPAALAAMLGSAGVSATPDELVSQTYLPGRKGSLQLELIAAARRHQRIPYVLAPDAEALFAELEAGHPVLVLQDLGVGPLHVWHYAVVIGYEDEPQQVVLRSGTTERLVMPYADFVYTWRKSGEWAAVVLAADVLPATANAQTYVESIVPVEALGHVGTARTAYATALGRWPGNLLALFGLANTEHQLGELAAAEKTYERLLMLAPNNPVVLNNLAEVQLARGCAVRAEGNAQKAMELVPSGSELDGAINDTREKAVAARAAGRDAPECDR